MKQFLIFCFLLLSLSSISQKTDKKLTREIEALLKNYGGVIGVYVKDIKKNKIVAINADTIFPTASMIKIPILVGVMAKIERGELQYNQPLQYRDSLLYAGVDILGSFKQDEKIDLSKVMMLMLTMSDNTSSLWLQSLAGTGTRINELLDSIGLKDTRMNSRTPGREGNRSLFGWGQTTPREMATLLEKIARNQLFSPVATERMQRSLSRQFWDGHAVSQIPPYISVYTKNGAVNESRSEVLYVNAPHRPYVFCISTKNNKDTSWQRTNEAWALTRKISKLLWEYFEPRDKWEPSNSDRIY